MSEEPMISCPALERHCVIALLMSDAVLALDIEQVLASVGFRARVERSYELERPEMEISDGFAAAIVDVDLNDARCETLVDWLAGRKVPTIILSADESVISTFRRIPSVVGRFLKPFSVDRILPILAAVAGPDPTLSPSPTARPVRPVSA